MFRIFRVLHFGGILLLIFGVGGPLAGFDLQRLLSTPLMHIEEAPYEGTKKCVDSTSLNVDVFEQEYVSVLSWQHTTQTSLGGIANKVQLGGEAGPTFWKLSTDVLIRTDRSACPEFVFLQKLKLKSQK